MAKRAISAIVILTVILIVAFVFISRKIQSSPNCYSDGGGSTLYVTIKNTEVAKEIQGGCGRGSYLIYNRGTFGLTYDEVTEAEFKDYIDEYPNQLIVVSNYYAFGKSLPSSSVDKDTDAKYIFDDASGMWVMSKTTD